MPICLPSVNGHGSIYEDEELVVSGWGYTSRNLNLTVVIPEKLQKVNVHSMTNTDCRNPKYLYEDHEIDEEMLCAINPNKRISGGVCYGDSGGPLMIQERNYFKIKCLFLILLLKKSEIYPILCIKSKMYFFVKKFKFYHKPMILEGYEKATLPCWDCILGRKTLWSTRFPRSLCKSHLSVRLDKGKNCRRWVPN